MSHTSTISSIKIQSISALRAAVTELNAMGTHCSLIENSTPRAYFENQAGLGKADFVLAIPDAKYDVGLYKTEDGSYEARSDFFGGSVCRVLGAPATSPESHSQAQLGKLFQMYGVCAATEAARKKGHMVRKIVKENGTISLEITGAGL